MFRLSDLDVSYGGESVLRAGALDIDDRAFTVLLGHNGSGKSTLMGVLARRVRPSRGQVTFRDRPLSAYAHRAFAREVAFLPQHLPDVPGLTVRELCGLGRFAWRGALRRWDDGDRDIVADALARTGMTALAGRAADSLSGGERQRAWIAMLLAQRAPVLLLDEPISALDIAHQVELLELLRRLNREDGRGVVVILHDINLAARFADRVLVLRAGDVAFDGTPDGLLDAARLSELFGTAIELLPHPARGRPVAVTA